MRQDRLEPQIVVLRYAQADQLTLGPGAAAVHGGIDAPRHRRLARETQRIQVARAVPILRCIERLYLYSRAILGVVGVAQISLDVRTPTAAGRVQVWKRQRHRARDTCALCSPAHPSPPQFAEPLSRALGSRGCWSNFAWRAAAPHSHLRRARRLRFPQGCSRPRTRAPPRPRVQPLRDAISATATGLAV